ncbi:TPA: hypothetical protein ACGZ96_003603 [Elizabethkingia anophelis]
MVNRLFFLFAFLFLSSCSITDTENVLNSGSSALSFNLLGAKYDDSVKLSSEASVVKGNITYRRSKMQNNSVLVTPSNFITAELSGEDDNSQALSKAAFFGGRITAVSGNPIISGVKFRVIAYSQSDGSYQGHQDYTVGQLGLPMILDKSEVYNIIAYSYGTSTLPAISLGEQNNINRARVNYDDINRDFMYQNIVFTPENSTETLNITLRHKVAQITTIVNSGSLENITGVIGGVLTPHYSDGSISLSSGVLSGRTILSPGVALNFSDYNTPIVTSTPVFVNADTDGSSTGGFSADLVLSGTTKTISLFNSFKITPGTKSNLTINLIRCGAKISDVEWKNFMCQNLGATVGINPLNAEAGNHGAKYQWGRKVPALTQEQDQNNPLIIDGWVASAAALSSWTDTTKTANDPCPTGYRVPTSTQWDSVIKNNNITSIGITWNSDPGNYSTGILIGTGLFLPAAGFRSAAFNGLLDDRGLIGYYWSSTSGSKGLMLKFSAGSMPILNPFNRPNGISIRCIAE